MTEQQRRTTQFLQFYILLNFLFSSLVSGKSSQPFCAWDSKAGAHYNIQPLMLPQGSNSAYQIVDGDIPCTPEIEPAFGYSWNFCDNVPSTQVPIQCKNQGKTGVVLQYVSIGGEDFCYILGHYDSSQHEIAYSQLDPADPSKGISLRFPAGEKCSSTNKKIRTATIDIQCANVHSVVVSAQEPAMCEYHLSMKSYYGCPTECPVTANGLCNSHGHCVYDKKAQKPYCYCNSGYAGAACDESASSSSKNDTYDGYSVQLGLLITLLILALGLTGGVVYLAYRVAEFRKTQINSHYTSLPGESEMVETLTFSR